MPKIPKIKIAAAYLLKLADEATAMTQPEPQQVHEDLESPETETLEKTETQATHSTDDPEALAPEELEESENNSSVTEEPSDLENLGGAHDEAYVEHMLSQLSPEEVEQLAAHLAEDINQPDQQNEKPTAELAQAIQEQLSQSPEIDTANMPPEKAAAFNLFKTSEYIEGFLTQAQESGISTKEAVDLYDSVLVSALGNTNHSYSELYKAAFYQGVVEYARSKGIPDQRTLDLVKSSELSHIVAKGIRAGKKSIDAVKSKLSRTPGALKAFIRKMDPRRFTSSVSEKLTKMEEIEKKFKKQPNPFEPKYKKTDTISRLGKEASSFSVIRDVFAGARKGKAWQQMLNAARSSRASEQKLLNILNNSGVGHTLTDAEKIRGVRDVLRKEQAAVSRAGGGAPKGGGGAPKGGGYSHQQIDSATDELLAQHSALTGHGVDQAMLEQYTKGQVDQFMGALRNLKGSPDENVRVVREQISKLHNAGFISTEEAFKHQEALTAHHLNVSPKIENIAPPGQAPKEKITDYRDLVREKKKLDSSGLAPEQINERFSPMVEAELQRLRGLSDPDPYQNIAKANNNLSKMQAAGILSPEEASKHSRDIMEHYLKVGPAPKAEIPVADLLKQQEALANELNAGKVDAPRRKEIMQQLDDLNKGIQSKAAPKSPQPAEASVFPAQHTSIKDLEAERADLIKRISEAKTNQGERATSDLALKYQARFDELNKQQEQLLKADKLKGIQDEAAGLEQQLGEKQQGVKDQISYNQQLRDAEAKKTQLADELTRHPALAEAQTLLGQHGVDPTTGRIKNVSSSQSNKAVRALNQGVAPSYGDTFSHAFEGAEGPRMVGPIHNLAANLGSSAKYVSENPLVGAAAGAGLLYGAHKGLQEANAPTPQYVEPRYRQPANPHNYDTFTQY